MLRPLGAPLRRRALRMARMPAAQAAHPAHHAVA